MTSRLSASASASGIGLISTRAPARPKVSLLAMEKPGANTRSRDASGHQRGDDLRARVQPGAEVGEYGAGVIAARDRGAVQNGISRLGPLFAVGVEQGKGCDRPGIRCKHLGQSVKWWRRDALERVVDDRQQIRLPPYRARHPMQQGKVIHLGGRQRDPFPTRASGSRPRAVSAAAGAKSAMTRSGLIRSNR